ncbi:predicted protein [Arabidopsis lyrata subsp. lyrata]|uniref:Predicted protein n=1 Tax=Arabidopsis lyrata subsp. lyrata TaxID=81972 RepID=D7M665_ARALL|nr:predicted protein [Arabidopsis lyrata subsp. lyrata]
MQKKQTSADLSRSTAVRPRRILEKMIPRTEVMRRRGTALGSQHDHRNHQEEGDLEQIYKPKLAPPLREARHLDLKSALRIPQEHQWDSDHGTLKPSHGAGRSRTPERQRIGS